AMPSTEGPADQAVEVLLVPADAKGKALDAKPRRQAEAAAVARRARELHEGGVAFREMAALFTGMGSVEVYQAALEQAGIRTYLLRGEGFYERREVLDLVLALRVARDPDDDQAMLGFLRSPFVALRDDTLLQLAWTGEGSCWARLRTVETAEPDRVALAIALVEEHAALRDRVPIHDLLTSLLDRSGYVAQLALQGDEARQAIANVRKFLRVARQHEGAAVGDFLRMIAELREREEREGDERLHGQQDDVMTLTTVHSAKGLEWDVVFWCDLERKPPNVGGRDSTLLIGRAGIALKDPDVDEKDDQPEAWRVILAAEGAESAAERKRLWYVAATRARQRLILGGVSAEGHEKGSPAEA
ncbi:MAG TPA: 3'-5' exonuclease, partial [Gemmatimonadales bacterium]|nr:3'-5' exonuclease [Gemmatimonadales bacterium]